MPLGELHSFVHYVLLSLVDLGLVGLWDYGMLLVWSWVRIFLLTAFSLVSTGDF